MTLATMAWRNVWRNRRRSLVTMSAMSFALLVMILYAGLFEGFFRGMERNILDLEVGDMEIFPEGYLDDPSLYKRIPDPEGLLARLNNAGFSASARLMASGLAAAGESSAGALLRGLDVSRDALVSRIHRHIAEGRWLDPQDPASVVLGKRLAWSLGVHPGDEVLVLTQAADGSLANELYRVRGVLKGVSDATDRAGLFMTMEAFRRLMALPEGAHQIIVRRSSNAELDGAVKRVRGLARGTDVRTWRELMPMIASMMDTQRDAMFVMFLIVYLAIGILILNAMLMAVFERVREFGMLKALGFGPGAVMRIIALESGIQILLAVSVGLALSVPGLWYLTRFGINLGRLGGFSVSGIVWDPVWKAAVTPTVYIGPLFTLLIIVALAAFYPGLKAAMIRPVEAMRHR